MTQIQSPSSRRGTASARAGGTRGVDLPLGTAGSCLRSRPRDWAGIRLPLRAGNCRATHLYASRVVSLLFLFPSQGGELPRDTLAPAGPWIAVRFVSLYGGELPRQGTYRSRLPLGGERPRVPCQPVQHVSLFWRGAAFVVGDCDGVDVALFRRGTASPPHVVGEGLGGTPSRDTLRRDGVSLFRRGTASTAHVDPVPLSRQDTASPSLGGELPHGTYRLQYRQVSLSQAGNGLLRRAA